MVLALTSNPEMRTAPACKPKLFKEKIVVNEFYDNRSPGTITSNLRDKRSARPDADRNQARRRPFPASNAGWWESREPRGFASHYPLCVLYEERIVDELRRRCPLSQPNPLAAIGDMENLGWQRYAERDYSGGIRVKDRAAVCERCIGRLIAHPNIVALRQNLEVTA